MRRSTAVLLLLSSIAFPACAQHGGSHGGFSGHAGAPHEGSGFHSSFGAPSAPRPSAPAYGIRNPGYRPGFAPNAAGIRRDPAVHYGARPLNYGAQNNGGEQGEHRSPYRSPYRHPERGGIIYEYPYSGVAWGYPYGLGYYGDYGFDDDDSYETGDSQAAPYYGPYQYNGFDPQGQGQTQSWPQNPQNSPEAAQLDPDSPYRPFYGAPIRPSNAVSEPVVTLVFKDHRPNQQIRNYVINGDTLTVWDQHPHEIALGQLDIGATEKLNHDAGVDFYLPGAPK